VNNQKDTISSQFLEEVGARNTSKKHRRRTQCFLYALKIKLNSNNLEEKKNLTNFVSWP
jgi:hypothetical protein